MKTIILIALTALTLPAFGGELVLKTNSLGPLNLSKEAVVSVKSLKELFPGYEVTHEIRSGDSPDFHYFDVRDGKGSLFSIISYIETQEQFKSSEGKINLLELNTSRIPDQYGIKIGYKFLEIRKKRKDKLEFGAGHFNNNIGGNNIYYSFSLEPTGYFKEIGINYADPVSAKETDAQKQNPEITNISWPYPAWE